jgi:hypothetical protein
MAGSTGSRRLGRRQLLRSVGGVAALALAGCTGGDGGGSPESTPTDGEASTPTTTRTAGEGATRTAVDPQVESRIERRGEEWIAFDEPDEQLSLEGQSEAEAGHRWLVETLDREDALAGDVDTLYLLVGTGTGETPTGTVRDRLALVIVSDDRSFADGIATFEGTGPYRRASTEQFFREHVSGYTATSEEFPPGLEELAAGAPQCLC